jgi:hypothetical protein
MTTEQNPQIYSDATQAKGQAVIELTDVDKFLATSRLWPIST